MEFDNIKRVIISRRCAFVQYINGDHTVFKFGDPDFGKLKEYAYKQFSTELFRGYRYL